MTYIPHTDEERKSMLETIGVDSLDQLFADVPEALRFPKLNLPDALCEMEAARELDEISGYNLSSQMAPIFLGAGAYNHYIPAVVDHILRRGEFYTAYTPYQPEVSQGTLQAIFEYQSMMCALTGMEVSNASHYDGGTALAEAVIMAVNVARNKKRKILLSSGIHPQYREIVHTYTQGMDLELVGEDLRPEEVDKLLDQLDSNVAMVAFQTPDFLGQVNNLGTVSEKIHASKALLCVVANPISLGLFTPPGEYGADIVVGEGQPLGIPMSYGGPYLGFFTTRKRLVRKMSGRVVGETVDSNGETGYVLTLSTREQHIRRANASSNICTNQGLMTLAASVYLSTMGKCGLRQVAELNYHKAHYAASRIDELYAYSVVNDRGFFNEFIVRSPMPIADLNDYLLENWGIIGGYDLGKNYAHLKDHMLVAVTELNTRIEIDDLVDALEEVAQ